MDKMLSTKWATWIDGPTFGKQSVDIPFCLVNRHHCATSKLTRHILDILGAAGGGGVAYSAPCGSQEVTQPDSRIHRDLARCGRSENPSICASTPDLRRTYATRTDPPFACTVHRTCTPSAELTRALVNSAGPAFLGGSSG